jgi:type IV secretory pathway TraG/TraD family ATPase VirD4
VPDTITPKSDSNTQHRLPLLTSDEIIRGEEKEAIIRMGNRHPMKLAKSYYNEPRAIALANVLGAAQGLKLMVKY